MWCCQITTGEHTAGSMGEMLIATGAPSGVIFHETEGKNTIETAHNIGRYDECSDVTLLAISTFV